MTTKDDMIAGVRKSLASLNVQREALELESATIVSELTAVNPAQPNVAPMGIDTPLTDSEGYPRNDIDVYRARTLRKRLAEIRTDHTKLMKEIETHLSQLASLQNSAKQQEEKEEYAARIQAKPKPKYDPVSGKWVVRNWDGSIAGAEDGGKDGEHAKRSFDNLSNNGPSNNTNNNNDEATQGTAEGVANVTIDNDEATVHRAVNDSSLTPFCKVNSVAPNSPAATAGLLAEDRITSFGPITGSMDGITELVRSVAASSSDNESIELRVLRNSDETVVLLRLQPRPWNGRGLLGCHIVPV